MCPAALELQQAPGEQTSSMAAYIAGGLTLEANFVCHFQACHDRQPCAPGALAVSTHRSTLRPARQDELQHP